jgi:CarboxypepD_reg-like domain
MSKQLQLTIPKPCHENWDAMTDVQKGKFCGSCQKQVVDFTNMSDRQLAQFFKKPSTGSVCGRFMNDQLEREIEIPKKRIPWLKYFFTIALPAFFISKASAQQPHKMGKVIRPALRDTTKTVSVPQIRMLGMVAPEITPVVKGDTVFQIVKESPKAKDMIRGRVVDDTGEPVPYASIIMEETKVGLSADSNGVFSIKQHTFQRPIKLIISSAGYETNEVEFLKTYGEIEIKLKTKTELPEVIVTTVGMIRMGMIRCYRTIGMAIDTTKKDELASQSKDSQKITATEQIHESSMKVYPNPTASGKSINLELEDIAEGYYSYELLTLSGQQIQQKEIWIDAEAKVLNIDLPSIAAGNYFISLINRKSRQKFTEKIIVL